MKDGLLKKLSVILKFQSASRDSKTDYKVMTEITRVIQS